MFSSSLASRRLAIRTLASSILVFVAYCALIAPLFVWTSLAVAIVAASFFLLLLVVLVTRGHLLALWTSRAVYASPERSPTLWATVRRLAQQADVPTPYVAIVPSTEPNAFTAGTGRHTVICVTLGLLHNLSTEEREAVFAHELAHVKNRDPWVMTVAAFPTTVALLLAAFSFEALDDGKGAGLVTLLAAAPLLVASYPAVLVLSRYREFAADRGGALMTGNPSALVSALRTIDGVDTGQTMPTADFRSVGTVSAFCLVSSGHPRLPFPDLHPSTEARIERLQGLERELARSDELVYRSSSSG